MASEEQITKADLTKIRKDYLKLSKAKLVKKCKALKLDAYGNKAELVDLLMKEHRKLLKPNKSKSNSNDSNNNPIKSPSNSAKKKASSRLSTKQRLAPISSTSPSNTPRNLRKLKTMTPRVKLKNDRSKSHDPEVPSIPKSSKSLNSKPSRVHRRGRSKSINITDVSQLRLKNRSNKGPNKVKLRANDDSKPIKKRRSSVSSSLPITDRKLLLKMSKSDLIKQCKLQNININGLKNRNEIINKLTNKNSTNIEDLFKQKKAKKKYKSQLTISVSSPSNSSKNGSKANGKSTKADKLRPKSARARVKKRDILRSKSHDVATPSNKKISYSKTPRNDQFFFSSKPSSKLSLPHPPTTSHPASKIMGSPLAPLKDIETLSDLEIDEDQKESQEDIKHILDISHCDFSECISRKRLMKGLTHYEQNYNDQGQNDKMMRYFVTEYKYLLSDWHHILLAHLDCKSSENFKNYNILYEDIKKNHLMCDIMECSHYVKNNRDREIEISEKNRKNSDEENMLFDHYNDDIDLNNQFLMDLLDNIHIYLVHGFDTGFRMRNYTDFGKQSINDKNANSDDDEMKYLWFDEEMESFSVYYENKRKELENIRGRKRVRNNKYFTCLDC